MYHGTAFILSIPEIRLLPDLIPLRWLPTSMMALVYTLLFCSTRFLGSRLITKQLNTSGTTSARLETRLSHDSDQRTDRITGAYPPANV